MTLCIYYIDDHGKNQPLSRELGWTARYRFDTGSEYNPIRILEELDGAANRVQGRLSMITGILSFSVQRKRNTEGLGIAPQVMFSLSELDIRRCEQEIRAAYLEDRHIDARMIDLSPAPAKQIAHDPAVADAYANPIGIEGEPVAGPGDADDEPEIGMVSPEIARGMNAESAPEPETEMSEGDGEGEVSPVDEWIVNVAEASDEELADALKRFVELKNAQNDLRPRWGIDDLNDVCFGNPDGYEYDAKVGGKPGKKREQVGAVDWFFSAPTEVKQKRRLEILRAGCAKLEAAANPLFVIRRLGVE